MDIKSLREIHRKERRSPYLQDVGRDFYQEVGKYRREFLSNIEKAKSGAPSKLALLLDEFENAKLIISGIYEIRERKIIDAARYLIKSGDASEIKNLTPSEEAFLQNIVKILREYRNSAIGEANHKEKHKEKVLTEEKKENFARITVRMLKDLPSIVGADSKVYGAFKKEDIVTLPEANAKVFLKQNLAEKIELHKV